MTSAELIVALVSSSGGTVIITEIVKSIKRSFNKRQGKGFSKLEADVAEIKATNEKIIEELDASKETEIVLLHDRIWQAFKFFESSEEISVEDRANIDYLYQEYEKKHGNHKTKLMYEYIKTIPVIPDSEIEGDLKNE